MGTEYVVPQRGAYSIPPIRIGGVVLHMPTAKHLRRATLRATEVRVEVHVVVREVAEDEPGKEAPHPRVTTENQVEKTEKDNPQCHRHHRGGYQAIPLVILVMNLVDEVVVPPERLRLRNKVEDPAMQHILKEGPRNEANDDQPEHVIPGSARHQAPNDRSDRTWNPEQGRKRRVRSTHPVQDIILEDAYAALSRCTHARQPFFGSETTLLIRRAANVFLSTGVSEQ